MIDAAIFLGALAAALNFSVGVSQTDMGRMFLVAFLKSARDTTPQASLTGSRAIPQMRALTFFRRCFHLM
jgi:hypothetical protein